MKMRMLSMTLAFCCGLTGAALAEPVKYQLPPETAELHKGTSPGFEAAQANCLVCHSADYLTTQPPKKGKAFWEAEVTKMVKVFGAKIAPDDARAIAEYLAEGY